jgi:hypothetical protein
MGPGGYKYRDFWKLGLPMEIIIATIAVPLILYFWPLQPNDSQMETQRQSAATEARICELPVTESRKV